MYKLCPIRKCSRDWYGTNMEKFIISITGKNGNMEENLDHFSPWRDRCQNKGGSYRVQVSAQKKRGYL